LNNTTKKIMYIKYIFLKIELNIKYANIKVNEYNCRINIFYKN